MINGKIVVQQQQEACAGFKDKDTSPNVNSNSMKVDDANSARDYEVDTDNNNHNSNQPNSLVDALDNQGTFLMHATYIQASKKHVHSLSLCTSIFSV
jgi:hypothetical protein